MINEANNVNDLFSPLSQVMLMFFTFHVHFYYPNYTMLLVFSRVLICMSSVGTSVRVVGGKVFKVTENFSDSRKITRIRVEMYA